MFRVTCEGPHELWVCLPFLRCEESLSSCYRVLESDLVAVGKAGVPVQPQHLLERPNVCSCFGMQIIPLDFAVIWRSLAWSKEPVEDEKPPGSSSEEGSGCILPSSQSWGPSVCVGVGGLC